MDVLNVAAELLGSIHLTSGQLGQLRALDYRLLLEASPRGAAPLPRDEDALRAYVVEEILQMLTPEQRAQLNLS